MNCNLSVCFLDSNSAYRHSRALDMWSLPRGHCRICSRDSGPPANDDFRPGRADPGQRRGPDSRPPHQAPSGSRSWVPGTSTRFDTTRFDIRPPRRLSLRATAPPPPPPIDSVTSAGGRMDRLGRLGSIRCLSSWALLCKCFLHRPGRRRPTRAAHKSA
jgi:hypothetical protein